MKKHFKEYMKEHIKLILAVTVMMICSVVVIGSNKLVAKILPDAAELRLVSCEMADGGIYEYTGKNIEPQINHLVFQDADGNEIVKESADIIIKTYSNNVEIGYADIEVSLNGYRRSIILEDIFSIQLGQVKQIKIAEASRTNIDLTWDKVVGADGYLVYRSADNGKTYKEMLNIPDGSLTTWQDKKIAFNSVYLYKVCAYKSLDEEIIFGNDSENVMQQTPLATPKLSSVSNAAYNALNVEWRRVDGAVGYQIYRSKIKDGKYECIKEISDGSTTTYRDGSCEIGIPYYYYVKAIQSINDSFVYGEASNVLSAKTKPNRVSLRGSTTEDDTKVTLKWKKSAGATGYEIYRSKNNTSNYSLVRKIESADTLSWTQSGLDKETVYYYKIRPYCVVKGTTITGSYSGAYEKEVTYVYSGPELSGEVSALTKYVGYSYVYGGTRPGAWDCSGFTQWVYKHHFGISLPRTSGEQATRGKVVSKNNRSAWKPGDLLFYKQNGRVSHVAIYLGGGQMIHALNSKYDTLIQGVDYYESWDRKTTLSSVRRLF